MESSAIRLFVGRIADMTVTLGRSWVPFVTVSETEQIVPNVVHCMVAAIVILMVGKIDTIGVRGGDSGKNT